MATATLSSPLFRHENRVKGWKEGASELPWRCPHASHNLLSLAVCEVIPC